MIDRLDAGLLRLIRTLSSPEAVGRLACTCRVLSTPEPEFAALRALIGTFAVRPVDSHNELNLRSRRRSRAIERGTLVVKAASSRCMLGLQWAFERMPWEEQYRQACYIALTVADVGWLDGFLWIASWVEQQPVSMVGKLAHGSAIGSNGTLGGGCNSSLILENAVLSGQVHIVKWMLARVPVETDLSGLASLAASEGAMAMLSVLRATPSVPWDETAWCGAAEGGHVHVLEWLKHIDCDRGPRQAEYDAAANGVRMWIDAHAEPVTAASWQARSAAVAWLGV